MTEESDATSRKSARLGPAGEAVRLNIRRIRDAQGISGAELSQRMRNEGRPIPLVGIQRIESGERRVDVDDLMAFAIVLGVTPITLLMPVGVQPDDGLSRYGSTAAAFWEWLRAELPLPSTLQGRPDFAAKALPPWELEKLERRWSLIDRVLFGGDDAVREMQRDNEAVIRAQMTPKLEEDIGRAMRLAGEGDPDAETAMGDVMRRLGIISGDD